VDADGNVLASEQTFTAGGYATKPVDPAAKEGKKFIGWYATPYVYSDASPFDFSKPISQGIKLYGIYKNTYKITYVVDDVTELVQEVVEGDKLTAFPTTITKDGYTLDGWYYNTYYYSKYELPKYGIYRDITLYARWVENGSGGSVSSGTNTSGGVSNGSAGGGTIDTDYSYDDDDSDDSTTSSSTAPVTVNVKNEDKSKVETTIKDVPEGSTVTISMSDDRTISKDILETAKGKDVDLVLDMGGYTWTINGKQITGADLNDVNLNVRFDTGNGISGDDISGVAGTNAYHTISLDYDGPFGFTARLGFNVGAENVGKYVNLYYMTPDSGLDYQNTGIVDADGNTSLVFTHASEYLAVISDGASATTNTKSPVTADSSTSVILMILLICAALSAFAACLIKRSTASVKR
jgi:hypothetical protein